jgi:hypothetical protein
VSELDLLGRRLAELQDRHGLGMATQESRAIPPTGEYLIHQVSVRRRRRRTKIAAVTALLVVGGAFVGLGAWPFRPDTSLATIRAESGQRVSASALDVAVDFQDGSRVVLASGASMRTEAVGPTTARVEIERGRASVRVKHTEATQWTVRAGGYAVSVTGTRFDVNWRPEKGSFSLSVEEGSVRVSGGALATAVGVSAGQSVTFEGSASPSATVPKISSPSSSAAGPTPAPAAPAPTVEPPPAETDPALRARPAAQHGPSPSWREHAERGRYREAMSEAERRGFDRICREASSSDLLTLAEAARYAGQPPRAEEALKAVRGRYGRSDDAATAAFLLGRIAAETARDPQGAAQWFRTYLAERPGGRLAREAEGRLLESLASTDRDAARKAAQAYLDRHPSGPHAGFARKLLAP